MRAAIDTALEPKPRPTTPSSWSPTPPPAARIDDAQAMADVTPSPATDGPFTLVTEHTLADGVSKEMRSHSSSDSRLVQLAREGKSIEEIGRILHDEETLNAAGPKPNV
jgi:CRISPR/Cas system CMR subunit Cmr4 (Cas7 group RAMP superfamily)